jgi:hypothetical protein
MNHTVLKNYAPQARRDFIQAVTDRAAFYGITAAKIEPVTEQGDVAIIGGRAFPASVVAKRKKLLNRIERDGFNQTMEALAYTWFNRFVAIRFMELHGYLDHGYRVLSHPDSTKTIPEILEFAEHVDLPGLNKEKVIDLKLDGNKESELYRMLLLAQCHALHSSMPFLFEGIDDETELVLPENLLHSDSIIRKLVDAGDTDSWQEVEVLGWLYQFYISERKDEVMARKSAVPTEDIPAVTQLFTPHWIVRYLVENSLGRLWLLNRPGSKLREHMPYYIEGEAETDILKVTKPEDIRLLDPACGSGHMLTYAFDLLFRIYEEEGYVPSEIPALILRHNLHGLEICPRATQLAELALVFKARAKSARFFQSGNLVPPRILALQNVHIDDKELRDYIAALDIGDLFNQPMLQLLRQFEEATNFGSLIQPYLDEAGIAYARRAIETKDLGSQLFLRETHVKVLGVLKQAEMLCQRYQVVVANPPYMGRGAMNGNLKNFVEVNFEAGKGDLYGAFMQRNTGLAEPGGHIGMITIPNWMFLDSFEQLRSELLRVASLATLIHNGRGLWGSDFGSCAFTYHNAPAPTSTARFKRLFAKAGEVNSPQELEARFLDPIRFPWICLANEEFLAIPGHPIAYWLSASLRRLFSIGEPLTSFACAVVGLQTSDNKRFLRAWFEPSFSRVALRCKSREEAKQSNARWFPYNKGGAFRKWFGNCEFVVDWEQDGKTIYSLRPRSVVRSPDRYFQPSLSWSKVTISSVSFRFFDPGFVFDVAGCSVFAENRITPAVLGGFLNSKVAGTILSVLSPTMNYEVGHVSKIPVVEKFMRVVWDQVEPCVMEMLAIGRSDWDNFETSWDFRGSPLLRAGTKGSTLAESWEVWSNQCATAIRRMQQLETENNRLFIDAYELRDELKPEVPVEEITLARADVRRDMAAFISYAVGCMMGRYSLDKPGLILAGSGHSLEHYLSNVGKPLNNLAFVPDEDGIIPVVYGEWFKGDIVAGVHGFLRATFGEATLEADRRFIEESLGKDLRTYFVSDFYKDHLQTYKKRPIYWLFSSGKERAFQALLYLHRYHEGTLSRMRTEYVIPLQGKIASRIDQLTGDSQKATSTSHRKKLEKELDTLLRQRTEIQAFDEKLRHHADQRIKLDLDDGVKVNYGKFGDLLAEVQAVTGGSEE